GVSLPLLNAQAIRRAHRPAKRDSVAPSAIAQRNNGNSPSVRFRGMNASSFWASEDPSFGEVNPSQVIYIGSCASSKIGRSTGSCTDFDKLDEVFHLRVEHEPASIGQ